MRYRVAFLLTTVLFLAGNAVTRNTEDDGVWYWAIRQSPGQTTPYIADQVLAYNINGGANVLLEDVWISYLYRLDSQTALVFLLVDDKLVPYIFNNTVAQSLTSSIDQETLRRMTGWGLRIKAATYPYFLVTSRSVEQEFLILDVGRNTLQLIPAPSDTRYCRDYFGDCMSISADGQRVRYLVSAQWDAGEIWFEIREYTINSNEIGTIYRYENPDINPDYARVSCEPDVYGEHWLCEEGIESPEDSILRYWIVFGDDTIQSLEFEEPRRWRIFFAENNLVVFDEFCGSICPVELSVPGNPDPMRYDLPERLSQLGYLAIIDSERLLLFISDEIVVR